MSFPIIAPVTGLGSGRRLLRLQAEEPSHNASCFKQYCLLNPTLDLEPSPRPIIVIRYTSGPGKRYTTIRLGSFRSIKN